MKWRFTFFTLLVVLALGGMAGVHGWLYNARDQVGYTAAEVQGDESALAGLSVETRYAYDRRLLWTTRFDADNPGGAATSFSYHLLEQPVENSHWAEEWVHVVCPLPLYDTEMALQVGEEPDPEDIAGRMAWDVAQGLEPGETVTKTVRVADYCQYLPMYLDFYGIGRNLSYTDQLNQALQEALSIPVPEDLEISLTVSLRTGYSSTAPSMQVAVLNDSGVILEDAIYLTLWPDTDLGLDLNQLALGYGVYRIPIQPEDEVYDQILPQITNFYPLDLAVVDRAQLLKSPIPGQLLVITQEAGKLFLTAVDTATGRALRRLELPGNALADHLTQEDVMLLATDTEGDEGEYLTALDFRNGACDLWMTEFYSQNEGPNVFFWDNHWDLAFDGQRLALAYIGSYAGPSVHLVVFDPKGQAYRGSFVCDAACVPSYPHPNVPQPITLTWRDN